MKLFIGAFCLLHCFPSLAEAPRNLKKVPWVAYGIHKTNQIEELMEAKSLNEVEALLYLETDKVNDLELSTEIRNKIKSETAAFKAWAFQSFGNPLEQHLTQVQSLADAHGVDDQSAAFLFIIRNSDEHALKAELTTRVHALLESIVKLQAPPSPPKPE